MTSSLSLPKGLELSPSNYKTQGGSKNSLAAISLSLLGSLSTRWQGSLALSSEAAKHTTQDLQRLMPLLPKQKRFIDEQYRYKYLLYGGAAGPGKSYGLRLAAAHFLVHWANKGVPRVRVGLFCEDYPSLTDRHLSKIKREFPPELGELKGTRDEGYGFYMRPEWGSGVISFRNLDKPEKYRSAEFAAIYVDEITLNQPEVFDDLRFRLRWPGIDHNPLAAASNPGGIGHARIKKLFIDRDFSGDDANLNPDEFLFIPGTAYDNPYLPASYWKTLESLPEKMRKALLLGEWDSFSGQVFTEWDRASHVVSPFPIPADWTRWVAIDYGYSAPFCALWFAKSPKTCTCYGDVHDHIYVYRELYASGLRAQEQAQRIKLSQMGERIGMYAADPSMWQKREGVQGDSLAQEYQQEGIHITKANNDRLAGWNAVHEALMPKKDQHGTPISAPRLRVFPGCTNLIRTLPALPYDKHRVEDVDTDAEDHAPDTLRYGLMALDGMWGDIPEIRLTVSGSAL